MTRLQKALASLVLLLATAVCVSAGVSTYKYVDAASNPFFIQLFTSCGAGSCTGMVLEDTSGNPLSASPGATAPSSGLFVGGVYNSSAPTPSTGQFEPFQLDASGRVIVACGSGCGGSGGTSIADEGAFTTGTTSLTIGGGFYQTTATSNPLTNGQAGAWQMTANRAGFVNLRNASGTEIGTTSNPVQVGAPSGAFTDGWNATEGTKADSAWSGSGPGSVVEILKAIWAGIQNGVAAIGSAVPADGLYWAGDAQSSEPAAATAGNLTGAFFDLVGKLVTSPYANRENQISGYISGTGTGANTIIAAPGAGIKIYGTDLTITRSDAGTTAISVTLNDTAGTVIDIPNNGGGGGFSHTYNVPLHWAANTAATCAANAGVTTLRCSLTGYKGY